MSPFIIKKSKKTPARLAAGGKPTYKKHRDDEDNKGIPESESGSGSDSEGGGSSSSVSVSVPEHRSTRRGTTITKKTKTAAANMVVGKIAEALASSVIAAAIANSKRNGTKKNVLRRQKSRRDDDDDEEEEEEEYVSIEASDDDEEENIEDSEDESEDEDDDEDDEDDEDSEEDEDDETYDDDDDDDSEDDDYFSDDDDDSDNSSEAEIARHKKHQKEMEQRCDKNKNNLAAIKETIQSLTTTMSSNASLANNKFMKKQLEEMKQKQRDIEHQLRADEKRRDKLNVKEFKTLLRKKNSTNDLRYFRRHMTPDQQQ